VRGTMSNETRASPRTMPKRGIVARYLNEFRLASYVLVIFALGHTLGAVVQTPHFGEESDTVVSAMKFTYVKVQGVDRTWYGFYRGFGILVAVFFVFSAVLTWHLGGMTTADRRRFAAVTWALFLAYVVSVTVSWKYFFPVPLSFSIALVILLGWAAIHSLKQ